MSKKWGIFMDPLPDGVAVFFVCFGTVLNILGIACAVCALLNAWRTYGRGPLWPWMADKLGMARVAIRRIMFWSRKDAHIHAVSASASSASAGSAIITLRKSVVFHDDTSNAERIESLSQAIQYIYKELDENREIADRKHSALTTSLNDITRRVDSESKRLETLSREVASGDVRLQLASILFIGLGTLFTAMPSIWQLII